MKTSRLAVLLVAALVPLALVEQSCVLGGFRVDDPVVDAGEDADADANGCGHATYPSPPDAGTFGPLIEFTVAIRSIDLGEDQVEAGSPPGLDLDNVCTCQGEEPGCVAPAWATQSPCDFAEGRDNAAARMFAYVKETVSDVNFGSALYSKTANEGKWSFLLRVSQYNGTPDDKQVTLAIYTTGGFPQDVDAGIFNPAWDGTDKWPVASDSVLNGDVNQPALKDDKAYVTGGRLVASVPNANIDLNGNTGHFSLKLVAGTIMADIVGENGQWKLKNGVVAARWALADIFQSMSTISIEGTTLCNDGGFLYTKFKEEVCSFADTTSKLGGPTAECDSLSFGIGFTADPVQLGEVYTPMVPMSSCPPGQDPALDSCDSLAP